MKVPKVVIIDTPSYFFVDQMHLLTRIREDFGTVPIYMCVNPENQYYQVANARLTKTWSFFNVNVSFSRNVDLDLINKVVLENNAKKFVIASNDGRLLWKTTEASAKPIYLRITYKSKNGKWFRPPFVFEKLKAYGYTVLDYRLANRIEGALAVILGMSYEEALKLWDRRKDYERSVILARNRVLSELSQSATFSEFEALCEKHKVFHPLETLYFLALYGDVKVKRNRREIVIINSASEEKMEEEKKEQEQVELENVD